MKNLKLTDLEKQVTKALLNFLRNDIGEDSFYDVSLNEIKEATGLKVDTLKGVLGSLVKKEIVDADGELYDQPLFGFKNQINISVEDIENLLN